MYNNCKTYGPYTSKQDGRKRMVLKHPDGRKQTISYPKYLVEMYLNRYLSDNETIDHIDGDFTNNELSNLRVIDRKTHSYQDALKYNDEKHICVWCNSEFVIKGDKLGQRNRRKSSGFCSKKCTGQYGAFVQNGGIPLKTKMNLKKDSYKPKSALKEISGVEPFKFGETCKMAIPSEAPKEENV